MLLFNGYWLMDNRQMFDNVWHYKDKVTPTIEASLLQRLCIMRVLKINWQLSNCFSSPVVMQL
jgi:hypothetical protein